MFPITGMIAATLTPFGGDGALNLDVLSAHVDYLAQAGLPAVAPAGTTGEFLYLSEAEREDAVRLSVQAAAGRMKVIAGIWALDTEGVGRLARAAERNGADAVFLTTPIYYPATDEAVVAWYRAARKHTGLPLFAYSIPQYAVNTVSTHALWQLMEEGTVQGIKDSSGKAERLVSLLNATEGKIAVYGASDSFTLQARLLEANGFISALANIYPRTCLRIWNGEPEEAGKAQSVIDALRTAVKGYGGTAGLKALLKTKGFQFGGTRLPFAELTPEAEEELLFTVDGWGYLD